LWLSHFVSWRNEQRRRARQITSNRRARFVTLNGGFDLELGGRGGVEVVFGIGLEGRLVALEGDDDALQREFSAW
jgi:hypothetical protein